MDQEPALSADAVIVREVGLRDGLQSIHRTLATAHKFDWLRAALADTVGYADPRQVARLFEKSFAVAGDRLACGHFHDTRGLGMANVYAAWLTGVRRFDACLGGIGGCPHAPGASGNVATEDLAYLFASMGAPTGLDFDALIALRARLAQWLDGETLHDSLWRAGLPKTMLNA